jgi:hypothetical protein
MVTCLEASQNITYTSSLYGYSPFHLDALCSPTPTFVELIKGKVKVLFSDLEGEAYAKIEYVTNAKGYPGRGEQTEEKREGKVTLNDF